MRNSMSAQSQDSVPPAPAWIVTNAGFLSNSPESNCWNSNFSRSRRRESYSERTSAMAPAWRSAGSSKASSLSTSRSAARDSNARKGWILPRNSETCSTSLWAVSLLIQNSGDAIRASTSARRPVRAGKSKKPPQLGEARGDGGGVDRFELFNHRYFCAGLEALVG